MHAFNEYLFNLSDIEINLEFSFYHRALSKVSALTETEYSSYSKGIITNIKLFLTNETLIEKWKQTYLITVKPCTAFYDSPVSELMCEFNPKYKIYQDNIHRCCSLAYDFLNSEAGCPLKNELIKKLHGYIDINSCTMES